MNNKKYTTWRIIRAVVTCITLFALLPSFTIGFVTDKTTVITYFVILAALAGFTIVSFIETDRAKNDSTKTAVKTKKANPYA